MNGFAYLNNQPNAYTNQVSLISPDGSIQHYDKQRLVPFAEYLPDRFRFLARWLPRVKKYRPGSYNTPVLMDKFSIATPLCYEALFPDLIRKQVTHYGAQIIINAGDDVWFGSAIANRIDASFSQLRAAENHRSVLRVFNSGISQLVLPDGSVDAHQGMTNRSFSHLFQVPLVFEHSLYSRWGNLLTGLLCLLSMVVCLFFKKQNTAIKT